MYSTKTTPFTYIRKIPMILKPTMHFRYRIDWQNARGTILSIQLSENVLNIASEGNRPLLMFLHDYGSSSRMFEQVALLLPKNHCGTCYVAAHIYSIRTAPYEVIMTSDYMLYLFTILHA